MNIVIGVVTFLLIIFLIRKKGISKKLYHELMAEDALLVDVRSKDEFKSGSMNGAINIPHSDIAIGIKKKKIAKDRPIILFCASGSRSAFAISTLKSIGYTNLYNGGSYFSIRNY